MFWSKILKYGIGVYGNVNSRFVKCYVNKLGFAMFFCSDNHIVGVEKDGACSASVLDVALKYHDFVECV